MSELVSEPIVPQAGSFDTGAMGRGEPGLPAAFTWARTDLPHHAARVRVEGVSREGASRGRGSCICVGIATACWSTTGRSGSSKLTRQASPGQNPRRRWFLYALDSPTPPRDATTEPPGPTNHGMPRDVT